MALPEQTNFPVNYESVIRLCDYGGGGKAICLELPSSAHLALKPMAPRQEVGN